MRNFVPVFRLVVIQLALGVTVTASAQSRPAGNGIPTELTQSEYATIAREITESYRLAGDEVGGEPSLRQMEALQRNAREAAVRRAAGQIVNLNRASDEAFERAKRTREQRIQVARAVMARAERGGYTREKTYEYYDPSANRWVQKTHTYDDSEAVYTAAKLRLESLQRMSDDELRSQVEYDKAVQMHVARAKAWDELVPASPQKFSGPDAAAPLVGVRLTPRKRSQAPVDPQLYFSERFDGQYVASNVSGRELRHVTLAVDFYHFSTVPEVTTRHVYYLPRWKVGEQMVLSRMLVPDETRGGARYDVPIHYRDGNANTPANPELLEMAGVVRMDVTVWSNEARQRTTTIDFAERIEKVAPALLEVAEGKLDNPAFTHIAKEMFHRFLPALVSLLPANSPYSTRAKELLRDPEKAREKLATANLGALLAACAEGKRYVGDWFGPSAGGAFGLLFIARDGEGKNIRAEVFDPKNPERRRLVAGYIAKDRPTRVDMVMFEPVVPGEGVVTGEAHEFRSNLLHPSVKSYRFQLRDGGLRGDASGSDLAGAPYDPSSRRHILLKPTDADARELAEAKRRNAAAPRTQRRTARATTPTSPRGRALPRSTRTQPTGRPSAKPRTAAERRAEAARIAQQNQQALNLLNSAKRALAARNPDLARRYLQTVITVAPDSPAAKQAERLMRNVEP